MLETTRPMKISRMMRTVPVAMDGLRREAGRLGKYRAFPQTPGGINSQAGAKGL
jgi:hypothetical protein